MTKYNEVIVEIRFRTVASHTLVAFFQHATVPERSIEVGFSLILSIYKKIAKMPPNNPCDERLAVLN